MAVPKCTFSNKRDEEDEPGSAVAMKRGVARYPAAKILVVAVGHISQH